MATRKIPNVDSTPETEKQTFEFDNGDLQVMADVEKQWKFKNKENLLRFALAVLARAKNKIIYVEDADGLPRPLSPGADLLKTNEDTTSSIPTSNE